MIKTTPEAEIIEDLIPKTILLPNETQADFDTLRQAVLTELAPNSDYTKILAENIVRIEWEMIRHRTMRDHLINSSYRKLFGMGMRRATGTDRSTRYPPAAKDGEPVIDENTVEEVELDEDIEAMAEAAVRGEAGMREAMAEVLKETGQKSGELVAAAYHQVGPQVQVHEDELLKLEERRRRLRADYFAILSMPCRAAEDAEVID